MCVTDRQTDRITILKTALAQLLHAVKVIVLVKVVAVVVGLFVIN